METKFKFVKTYMDEHLGKRVATALLVGFLFMIIGSGLPDMYYRYLDKTQYLTIVQPISIDKKFYHPCDAMTLTTKITSSLDVNVKTLTQLVLVRQDSSTEIASRTIEVEIPIRAQNAQITSGSLKLSCSLINGTYFWQGTATYPVRGYNHTVSFISETFTIEK